VSDRTPRIVAFCCEHSASKCLYEAVSNGARFDGGVMFYPVECSGRVDAIHILKAFEQGADGVLVLGCFEDACNFVSGNVRASKRVEYLKAQLKDAGLDPDRLSMVNVSPATPARFLRAIDEMAGKLNGISSRAGFDAV